jgi:tRNA1Val (adenine37-N6)-methyltransferase
MPNPYFQFKKFTVMHDRCAMKVGTDGVLLGAWATPPENGAILDVGTGSGLIALMLAQKSNANITGIEIDLQAAEQARENVEQTPWRNRIHIEHSTFQKHVNVTSKNYDMVITNPPFFADSLNAPELNRTNARHQTELRMEELFAGVKKVLKPQGCFCMIYPVEKEPELLLMASVSSLYPYRIMYVKPTPRLPPKRMLINFCMKKVPLKSENLVIESVKRHNYTEQYKKLTKDYYLAF